MGFFTFERDSFGGFDNLFDVNHDGKIDAMEEMMEIEFLEADGDLEKMFGRKKVDDDDDLFDDDDDDIFCDDDDDDF